MGFAKGVSVVNIDCVLADIEFVGNVSCPKLA